ncbi:hypothetical protein O181_014297 [Austropuccinia psidii MF-1]|uniref:Uncharacterized protein n=1 Tax=Austropuccinia psidii MF-1 TaxID=1389203 RepID=A0A9Q3GPQ2_9BASI|nr:hypothetical protein [Austropuccinia psidii MF-1]
MSLFSEQTPKEFERPHERNSRFQEMIALSNTTIHTLQESYTKLSKNSEETNRIFNQVVEEKYHLKRDRIYLDQDTKKFLNVSQKIKTPIQGHVFSNNPQIQEDIKPDSPMDSKSRSQSQYQD